MDWSTPKEEDWSSPKAPTATEDWSSPKGDEVVNEQRVSEVERTTLNTLAPNNSSAVKWLREKGYEADLDEGGEVKVRRPGEATWGRVEPLGFLGGEGVFGKVGEFARDFTQDAGDEAAATWAMIKGGGLGAGAGSAAGPVGTALGAMGGTGAGAAAAEAARRAAGQAVGFEDTLGDAARDVIIHGALGAAGEGVIRGGGAAIRALTKGKPAILPKVHEIPGVRGQAEHLSGINKQKLLDEATRQRQALSGVPREFATDAPILQTEVRRGMRDLTPEEIIAKTDDLLTKSPEMPAYIQFKTLDPRLQKALKDAGIKRPELLPARTMDEWAAMAEEGLTPTGRKNLSVLIEETKAKAITEAPIDPKAATQVEEILSSLGKPRRMTADPGDLIGFTPEGKPKYRGVLRPGEAKEPLPIEPQWTKGHVEGGLVSRGIQEAGRHTPPASPVGPITLAKGSKEQVKGLLDRADWQNPAEIVYVKNPKGGTGPELRQFKMAISAGKGPKFMESPRTVKEAFSSMDDRELIEMLVERGITKLKPGERRFYETDDIKNLTREGLEDLFFRRQPGVVLGKYALPRKGQGTDYVSQDAKHNLYRLWELVGEPGPTKVGKLGKLPTTEIEKGQFRSVHHDKVLEIRLGGKVYRFSEEGKPFIAGRADEVPPLTEAMVSQPGAPPSLANLVERTPAGPAPHKPRMALTPEEIAARGEIPAVEPLSIIRGEGRQPTIKEIERTVDDKAASEIEQMKARWGAKDLGTKPMTPHEKATQGSYPSLVTEALGKADIETPYPKEPLKGALAKGAYAAGSVLRSPSAALGKIRDTVVGGYDWATKFTKQPGASPENIADKLIRGLVQSKAAPSAMAGAVGGLPAAVTVAALDLAGAGMQKLGRYLSNPTSIASLPGPVRAAVERLNAKSMEGGSGALSAAIYIEATRSPEFRKWIRQEDEEENAVQE